MAINETWSSWINVLIASSLLRNSKWIWRFVQLPRLIHITLVGMSVQHAFIVKIRILAHQGKTVCFGTPTRRYRVRRLNRYGQHVQNRGKYHLGLVPAWVTSSRQTIASSADNAGMPFPVGCKRKTCQDVFMGQIVEIFQNFLLGHARRKIIQHIVNGDPHPPYARLAAPFAGFDSDNLSVAWVHVRPFVWCFCLPIEYQKDSMRPIQAQKAALDNSGD